MCVRPPPFPLPPSPGLVQGTARGRGAIKAIKLVIKIEGEQSRIELKPRNSREACVQVGGQKKLEKADGLGPSQDWGMLSRGKLREKEAFASFPSLLLRGLSSWSWEKPCQTPSSIF